MASSSGGNPGPGPLPTAPPSYEEAVGLTGPSIPGVAPGMQMTSPVPGAPPYPVAGAQMPMPTPCNYNIIFHILTVFLLHVLV